MNITELKKDQKEFHAKLVISAQEIEDQLKAKLVKIASTAKIDGFRPGKVPVQMVRKKYGASVRSEIITALLKENITKIIKDNNLDIVTEPKIDDVKIEDAQDAEFTLKFELMPVIEIPNFKKITLEKPVLQTKEKDVEERINQLKSTIQQFETNSKGKAKIGDQVTIDAIGYVDSDAFEGGKLQDHKLVLGSGSFIDNFEQQLVDCKAGDKISVNVTFPEKYHAASLAGKPAEFKTEIKAVHKPSKIEVNEEFAKKFNVASLEELQDKIKLDLQNYYSEAIHVMLKMKLFDQLETMIKFEAPKSLLEREIESLKQQKEFTEDPIINSKSAQEKEEYLHKLASRRIKIGLVIAEYVKKHNITLEESDLKKALLTQAKMYPRREQELINFYQNNKKALETLKSSILEEKGVDKIFAEEIQLTEKTYSKNKLEKILEEAN